MSPQLILPPMLHISAENAPSLVLLQDKESGSLLKPFYPLPTIIKLLPSFCPLKIPLHFQQNFQKPEVPDLLNGSFL